MPCKELTGFFVFFLFQKESHQSHSPVLPVMDTVKRVPHHYPDPLVPDRVRRDVVLATLSAGQVDMVDHHCLSLQV